MNLYSGSFKFRTKTFPSKRLSVLVMLWQSCHVFGRQAFFFRPELSKRNISATSHSFAVMSKCWKPGEKLHSIVSGSSENVTF